MVKRHVKKGRSQSNPEGGIVEKNGTLALSNVMPVDPGSDKATRVKVKRDENGRAQRHGKSGTVIEAAK